MLSSLNAVSVYSGYAKILFFILFYLEKSKNKTGSNDLIKFSYVLYHPYIEQFLVIGNFMFCLRKWIFQIMNNLKIQNMSKSKILLDFTLLYAVYLIPNVNTILI